MAAITGLGTTYDLPNYTGVLHQLSPTATPLFSAIGSLTGGGQTTDTEFEWQAEDLRNPSIRTRLEGADAPTAEERTRTNVTNVVEIHQEQVAVSYTKLAAFGRKSGVNNEGTNPVRNELDHQVAIALRQVVRDVNYSFWNGVYNKPSTNAGARSTRGLFSAISTNKSQAVGSSTITGATAATDTITSTAHGLSVGAKIVFAAVGTATAIYVGPVYYVVASTANTIKVATAAGGAAITIGTVTDISIIIPTSTELTSDTINGLAEQVWVNGGADDELTAVLATNSRGKIALSKAFTKTYEESSRSVGGVNVSTIVTDFGTFGVLVDRAIRQDRIALLTLGQLRPVYLEVPGKGHFFAEPLAKTGASDKVQLYGEVGLEYGPEQSHGFIEGLAV